MGMKIFTFISEVSITWFKYLLLRIPTLLMLASNIHMFGSDYFDKCHGLCVVSCRTFDYKQINYENDI